MTRSERRVASVVDLAVLALAGGVLVASWVDAKRTLRAIPVVDVRGPPLVAVRADAEEQPTQSIEGDGTDASPARVPMAWIEFPAYDPPSLRVDATPLLQSEFPSRIGAQHGRVVALTGYPVVSEVVDGVVVSVILSRFPPGCCFGQIPVLDEWVDVQFARAVDPAAFDPNRPVSVAGVLEVGEQIGAGGAVESLYRLRGARIE